MDSVTTIHYSVPPPYALTRADLTGYPDTTDLGKSSLLWLTGYETGLPADLIYPKTGAQAYELSSGAKSASTNEDLSFYNFGTTVPTSLPFQTGETYSILTNQQDNFSVSFSSGSPSVYFTTWKAGKVSLLTVASPDSSVLHPSSIISNLNSKLMHGLSFNGLTAVSFGWAQYDAMDYPALLGYFDGPTNKQTNRVKAVTSYQKTF